MSSEMLNITNWKPVGQDKSLFYKKVNFNVDICILHNIAINQGIGVVFFVEIIYDL